MPFSILRIWNMLHVTRSVMQHLEDHTDISTHEGQVDLLYVLLFGVQHTCARQAITPCTPALLTIALKGRGCIPVHYPAPYA
jgi:hypothetical protein